MLGIVRRIKTIFFTRNTCKWKFITTVKLKSLLLSKLVLFFFLLQDRLACRKYFAAFYPAFCAYMRNVFKSSTWRNWNFHDFFFIIYAQSFMANRQTKHTYTYTCILQVYSTRIKRLRRPYIHTYINRCRYMFVNIPEGKQLQQQQ